MGFSKDDYQAMRDIGMSDAQIYHCAGDSIISLCLVGIIGMATDIEEQDLYKLMEDYVETLKEN